MPLRSCDALGLDAVQSRWVGCSQLSADGRLTANGQLTGVQPCFVLPAGCEGWDSLAGALACTLSTVWPLSPQ